MATVDKQYLYSIGRVKELEKGLLAAANLVRVLEADDPLAVLRSIGFFRTTDEHEGHESLTQLFELERAGNRKLLHELIADSPLEDIFLLPVDFENIKLLVKAKLVGNDELKHLTGEEGKFRRSELVTAIFDNMPTDVPAVILDDVNVISENFQNQRRFAPIDARLHGRLRALQLGIARRAGNTFMVDYLQRVSDIQNISTTLRRKFHQCGRDSLTELLLDTGTLAPQFFEQVYDGGWESLASGFKPTAYSALVTSVIAELEPETFFPALDVAGENFLIEFLQTTKLQSVGIEPILAFYLARDHELRMVRAILTGKRFEYAQEKLQHRLKELYA